MAPRYAIYFVPPAESALYRFGAAAIGYDCYTGETLPALSTDDIAAVEWRKLTAEPRRYGFHATLKAPFRLKPACTEQDLRDDVARFAQSHDAPAVFPATIRLLSGFVAVVPGTAANPNALADTCVRAFDRFRAPMSEADRARRLAAPMSVRQVEHVDRWGYPYVFEDFRFHMTLTGRLPAERVPRVLGAFRAMLKRGPVPAGLAVEAITLLRQDEPEAPFLVVMTAPLQGKAQANCPEMLQVSE